jgi:hypothetical protein
MKKGAQKMTHLILIFNYYIKKYVILNIFNIKTFNEIEIT